MLFFLCNAVGKALYCILLNLTKEKYPTELIHTKRALQWLLAYKIVSKNHVLSNQCNIKKQFVLVTCNNIVFTTLHTNTHTHSCEAKAFNLITYFQYFPLRFICNALTINCVQKVRTILTAGALFKPAGIEVGIK